MAERRMFAKSIIESDPFMDMPAEAQMLYIRLNMAADDDGFCDNPRSIMRSCGASDDSMRLLISKKFVLTFSKKDNFIVVIKHWRMNNYIRKDTYHETKYKEFMRELYYDENHSYSLNPGDGHVPCISEPPEDSPEGPPGLPPPVRDEPVTPPSRGRDEPLTQDRLGKDKGRLEEGESKDNSSLLSEKEEKEKEFSPESHAEAVASCAKLISSFTRRGWDTFGAYKLAEAKGVTREEIDEAIRQMEEKGDTP